MGVMEDAGRELRSAAGELREIAAGIESAFDGINQQLCKSCLLVIAESCEGAGSTDSSGNSGQRTPVFNKGVFK